MLRGHYISLRNGNDTINFLYRYYLALNGTLQPQLFNLIHKWCDVNDLANELDVKYNVIEISDGAGFKKYI